MFRIVDYRPEHLRGLALQTQQAELAAFIAGGDYAENVARAGPAWTALAGDAPIACAGFHLPWPGRAIAWAVLAEGAGREMLRLTRAVRRALSACPAERIEAQVLESFGPGLRWVAALGFTSEGRLRRFSRGEDYRSFVILKDA
jgi:hypothetical protein